MKDRIWERFYSIPQKLFSFNATRPVLLLRGLVLFAIGILGILNPVFVLTTVTMILGGVVLLFAVAAFLMAWNSGRVSASLLLLFFLLGLAGLGLLIYPLYFDMFLMVVCGVWLIFAGVWSILSVQKRFGQLVLPMPGLVAALIGVLLVVAPFIGVAAISWTAALLALLFGAQMILLALGLDAGKWVIPDGRRKR
ncbi:MAG: DUF308 domain-containing protein [Lentisphaeria bacterium]|nr:DUF308 domain-containing protein [Lentisphaeria bacterium]